MNDPNAMLKLDFALAKWVFLIPALMSGVLAFFIQVTVWALNFGGMGVIYGSALSIIPSAFIGVIFGLIYLSFYKAVLVFNWFLRTKLSGRQKPNLRGMHMKLSMVSLVVASLSLLVGTMWRFIE